MGGEEIDEGASDVCCVVAEGDEAAGLDRRALAAQFAVGVAIDWTLFISMALRFDFKVISRHILYRHILSIRSSVSAAVHLQGPPPGRGDRSRQNAGTEAECAQTRRPELRYGRNGQYPFEVLSQAIECVSVFFDDPAAAPSISRKQVTLSRDFFTPL